MKQLALAAIIGLSTLTVTSVSQAKPVVVERPVVVSRDLVRPVFARPAAVKPTAAVVLRTLPRGYKRIVRSSKTYFLANGIYYFRDSQGYVVVRSIPA